MVAVEVGSNQEPCVLTGAITREGGNNLTGRPAQTASEISCQTDIVGRCVYRPNGRDLRTARSADADSDFSVYRKHGRVPIAIISPQNLRRTAINELNLISTIGPVRTRGDLLAASEVAFIHQIWLRFVKRR